MALVRKGMTAAELARRLDERDRTGRNLRRRLRGEVPLTVAELIAIARLLDVPVIDLIEREDER